MSFGAACQGGCSMEVADEMYVWGLQYGGQPDREAVIAIAHFQVPDLWNSTLC